MTGLFNMGGNSTLTKPEAIEICRILGLAISNISMYGMQHSVTQNSINAAYEALKKATSSHRELEFVMGDSSIILNGTPVDTERTTGQLLVNQLNKLGVHDFCLAPPLNQDEFSRFAAILAAVPGSEALTNGFESAVESAGLKTIKVKNVSYAKVDKDADLAKMNFEDLDGLEAKKPKPPKSGGAKVFDLDADLDMDMDMSALGFAPPSEPVQEDLALTEDIRSFIEKKQAVDALKNRIADRIKAVENTSKDPSQIKEEVLRAGLSEADWYDLLADVEEERKTGSNGVLESLRRVQRDVAQLSDQRGGALSGMVDAIGQEIARITNETKGEITTLAGKVDADRDTIARIEREARDSGVGLNLSREELLDSLAEINQELGQSLTVVTSVTDILGNGKLGQLTPEQQSIMRMATDGVTRINKLVNYLTRLSGMPRTLSPDTSLLDEAYEDS